MVAYGIKLSVEARFNGDVTLDAKTSEFARHYERELAKQELRAQLIRGFFDSKVSPGTVRQKWRTTSKAEGFEPAARGFGVAVEVCTLKASLLSQTLANSQ